MVRKLFACGHLCDFVCKVLFSLLDAFALLKAVEVNDLDFAAHFLSSSCYVLANLHFVVLNVGHIEQAVVVVELGDTAFNHLKLDLFRLLCVCRIVSDLSEENVLLFFDNGCGNALTREIRSGICADLESDILCEYCEKMGRFHPL